MGETGPGWMRRTHRYTGMGSPAEQAVLPPLLVNLGTPNPNSLYFEALILFCFWSVYTVFGINISTEMYMQCTFLITD